MIGIDVGGANLKIVDDDGAHILYCPLWENAPLTAMLYRYVTDPDEETVAVMSGDPRLFSRRQKEFLLLLSRLKGRSTMPAFMEQTGFSMNLQWPSSLLPTGLHPQISCGKNIRMQFCLISAVRQRTSSLLPVLNH
jgi:hypothetical protein